MSNNAKERLLHAHTSSTWNAWVGHWSFCERCNKESTTRPIEEVLCLDGAAAFDEYRIAQSRLDDHLNGKQRTV